MATQTRLNITLTDEELTLLKSVAPHRKLSNFIKEAAVARAKVVHRQNLRLEIIQAYEADPEFQKQAGADWGPSIPRRMAGTLTRGEVYMVQLSPAIGTELNSPHPCVVVQSDLLEHDLRPRTIVVPITSREPRKPLPFIVAIRPPEGGLIRISYALCDQVTRIDKSRIIKSCGMLSAPLMAQIDSALRLALEL